MAVLKEVSFPDDILKQGAEGTRVTWHQAKLRGCGYSRASEIVKYAETSIGPKDGTAAERKRYGGLHRRSWSWTKNL